MTSHQVVAFWLVTMSFGALGREHLRGLLLAHYFTEILLTPMLDDGSVLPFPMHEHHMVSLQYGWINLMEDNCTFVLQFVHASSSLLILVYFCFIPILIAFFYETWPVISVAYLLGLPILGYSLDIGKEHVNLIDEKLEKLIYSGQLDAKDLDRYDRSSLHNSIAVPLLGVRVFIPKSL